MNIPNMLTIFRLFLIPIFVLSFFSDMQNSLQFSIVIFVAAGFTDFLDGYIARKYKLITKLGIVLDPLADKLMLIAVLTCLVIKTYIPVWILLVILSKEVFMIFCGISLYKKGMIIPSNVFGKLATIFFYISIVTLIFDKTFGLYLIYASAAMSIIALANYLIIYYKN